MDFCISNAQTTSSSSSSTLKTVLTWIGIIVLIIFVIITFILVIVALVSSRKAENDATNALNKAGTMGPPGIQGLPGPSGSFQNIGVFSVYGVSQGSGNITIPVDNKIIVNQSQESTLLFNNLSTDNSNTFIPTVSGVYLFNVTIDVKKDDENSLILRAYKGVKQHIGYYTIDRNGSFSTTIMAQLDAGETFQLTVIPSKDKDISINSLGTFISAVIG